MSSVSEWIVREYFESLGFMVGQPCKYHVARRRNRGEEDICLIAVNPSVSKQQLPEKMLWTCEDLARVSRAAIGVCGWHSERIYTAMLESAPEILGFMSTPSLRIAAGRTGSDDMAKIICLSQLPVSEKLRQQMLAMLRQKGVDGVLLFRTMLAGLIKRVDMNRNYEKSDLLQVIRILKKYDLLRDPQLELFG